mgnify:CR=1 FL=1
MIEQNQWKKLSFDWLAKHGTFFSRSFTMKGVHSEGFKMKGQPTANYWSNFLVLFFQSWNKLLDFINWVVKWSALYKYNNSHLFFLFLFSSSSALAPLSFILSHSPLHGTSVSSPLVLGWYLEDAQGDSKLTYLPHSDPRGSIPIWAVWHRCQLQKVPHNKEAGQARTAEGGEVETKKE